MIEEQKKSSLGGKRAGAGRKPAGTAEVKIRLTPEQHKKLSVLGGSAYLQKHLDMLLPNRILMINLTERQQWLLTALGDSWIEDMRKDLLHYNSSRCTTYTIEANELTICNESEEGTNFSQSFKAENVPVPNFIDVKKVANNDALTFHTKAEALTYIDRWIKQDGLDESAIQDLLHMKDLILAHQGVRKMSESEWFTNALKTLEEESHLPLFVFDRTKYSCNLIDVLEFGNALHRYALSYDELESFILDEDCSISSDGTERFILNSPAKALLFALENRDKFNDKDFYQAQRRILAWLDNQSAV